jgi:hypothetical protein
VLPAEEALITEVGARDAAQPATKYLHSLFCCGQSRKVLATDLPSTTPLKQTNAITTTATSATTKTPPNGNSTQESPSHPTSPSANPAPSDSETTRVRSLDTTEPNANTAAVTSMQDYGRPPPDWKPEDEYGWMDYLMPSLKTIKRTRRTSPSTDEIAILEYQLDDMLDILNFHNSIFRHLAYIGMLLSFCLAIGLIAFIERQLEAMMDSLVYPTSIYKAGFWAGLHLSIVSSIRLWTWRQDGSPRSFVEKCFPWLVACELGLAVWILRLPPAPYRLAVDG